MDVDKSRLAEFLVKAKKATYASGGPQAVPERTGFREFEFRDAEWKYRDSYVGYYVFQGQEVVRRNQVPVWLMNYRGGMHPSCHDRALTKQAYDFLGKALRHAKGGKPFRGPGLFQEEDFQYISSVKGTITDFSGVEYIYHQCANIYTLHHQGGLIVPR